MSTAIPVIVIGVLCPASYAALIYSLSRLRSDLHAGFDRMEARFDRLDDSFNGLDARLDARFDRLDDSFDRLEAKFDELGMVLARRGLLDGPDSSGVDD